MSIASRILSVGQNKVLAGYKKRVRRINEMEPQIQDMSSEAIIHEMITISKAMKDGGNPDKFIERAYALLREHIKRCDGRRAYDVQLLGAFALNDGNIIEANTGEGKTVISHFPAFFKSLQGLQTHIVTVNEYLAKRDAMEMNRLMRDIGVRVGYIYNQQPQDAKKQAYRASIVYGTPSEFGFDYLRDNMVVQMGDKVQRHRDYVIIDEVDSILIDEARTPLIISGQGKDSVDAWGVFARIVKKFKEGRDFEMDESKKTISATEEGLERAEKALGIDDLYAEQYASKYPRYLKQSMTAQFLYHKDKDYIVEDGQVKIVDPNTGRVMEGRRWADGLHQAIEAKEHVKIQQENETYATVTLQNFFRLYHQLSGMTGTAMTEDAEFRKTYGIGVVKIPPNKPSQRKDLNDLIYKDEKSKYAAVVKKIQELNEKGQPVLVGTASVENSEKISKLLKRLGIKHSVLNAKNHEAEARIISQAGRYGAVTIATNMAGRGTDIYLGGNPDDMFTMWLEQQEAKLPRNPQTGELTERVSDADMRTAREQINKLCSDERSKVLKAGGLYVLGTERHESRRIDNQLRGRAGRQGDPGVSQFYVSLDDDLMRLFGGEAMERIQKMMDNLPDDMPISVGLVSKGIENAQHNVESMRYEQRKNTLEYDDVINKQRLAIYKERDALLIGRGIEDKIKTIIDTMSNDLAFQFTDDNVAPDDWNYDALRAAYIVAVKDNDASFIGAGKEGMGSTEEVADALREHMTEKYEKERMRVGKKVIDEVSRRIMLANVDESWREHLTYMDYLKNSIGLRSIGQKDPLTEYRDEAYSAFEFMVDSMYQDSFLSVMNFASKYEKPKPVNGGWKIVH